MTAVAEKYDCPVPWCTRSVEHYERDCSGEMYYVHGADVGTRIGLWLETEESGEDRPVAVLGLTGRRDASIDSLYLEVDELRDLARAAGLLADALEGGRGYVMSGERR